MKIAVKSLLGAVVLTLCLAGCDPYRKAKEAYNRGDYALAARLYLPLAEQGNAEAQYILGEIYSNGKGVLQDYTKSAPWFLKAAEQGLAEAQAEVGVMYSNGQGVPKDAAESAKWFSRAAAQGNPFAQSMLAMHYYFGSGLPQDFVQAYKWYILVAAQATNNDAFGYKDVDYELKQTAQKMTPEQIAEAQKLAREWKPKKEDRGD